MAGPFPGGGDSPGGIIIPGAWATLGDEDGTASRDDIARGDEMRPADGGWAGAALEGTYGRELVEGAGARLGEATYGSKDDDAGTT